MGRGGRLLIVICLLIGLLMFAEKQLAPVLDALAVQQAHSTALVALEAAVQQTLALHPEYHDYQQLITLEKDSNGHVAVMIPNTMRLNELVSDTLLDVDQKWAALQRQYVSIPIGTLSGSRVLAGLGPDIHLRFSAFAAPTLSLKDEFTSAGINQTQHRIWLDISAEIQVSAPFRREKVDVTSSILLAESLIVGPIPETYVNFAL